MTVTILIGDVRAKLAELPDESVHCVVTSPPYWGLRCYGVDGQLGQEPTLGEHIETMVSVFRDVRRVLRKDGTFWLNYGDCYATAPNGRSADAVKALGNDDRTFRDKPFSTVGPICDTSRPNVLDNKHKGGTAPQSRIRAGGFLKPKDLCMIPARLAIALQDDGWWIRSEIIWAKPNPMPESVRDRPTSAHEKIYLLTKSQQYYYDAEATKKPAGDWGERDRSAGKYHTDGFRAAGQSPHSGLKGQPKKNKQRGHSRRHAGFNDRWNAMTKAEQCQGANLRNVWNVATQPFSEAHFATFPPKLIEPCIKAGCPEGGTVLDPFLGSGTTGLVADQLGRDCIGIELNPEYAAMARKRIDQDAATRGEGPSEIMRGDDLPLFA